ncbi:MAG TPA: FHA domain-containing protein [Myxococcota bacterium]
MPVVTRSPGESSLGSAIALESLTADARSLSPDGFAERHGTSFLLFTAKKLATPKSESSTNLLLDDGDDDAPDGRTANLAIVVYPMRSRDPAKGTMITLGREASRDVVIPDMSVSRFHAFAKPGPDGALVIQDAGSTNGTMVNGESVLTTGAGPARRLKPGDNVRLGHIEMTFTDARALREFVLQKAR